MRWIPLLLLVGCALTDAEAPQVTGAAEAPEEPLDDRFVAYAEKNDGDYAEGKLGEVDGLLAQGGEGELAPGQIGARPRAGVTKEKSAAFVETKPQPATAVFEPVDAPMAEPEPEPPPPPDAKLRPRARPAKTPAAPSEPALVHEVRDKSALKALGGDEGDDGVIELLVRDEDGAGDGDVDDLADAKGFGSRGPAGNKDRQTGEAGRFDDDERGAKQGLDGPSPQRFGYAGKKLEKKKGRKRDAEKRRLEEETEEEAPVDENSRTVRLRRRNAKGQLILDELRIEGRVAKPRVDLVNDGWLPNRDLKPDRFLPRMAYFENTYLGGNAAYHERLRRVTDAFGGRGRPFELASLPEQPFDPPIEAGLALTTALDTRWLDKPGRVILQIGLQGSRRFGWRRPPLDVMLVADAATFADPETLTVAVTALLRRLGPQDRVGVVVPGARPSVVSEVTGVRDVRVALGRQLESFERPADHGPRALAEALRLAGDRLFSAAADTARIPGTQTVLLLTASDDPARVRAATGVAHQLTTRGAVTSVIELGARTGGWWALANAGHGNDHHAATTQAIPAAIEAELESLSRVIARLLRVNVKLAPHVEAIRVLGSRVLGQQEVKRVKAREVATDRNLSRTMGVKADRGDDDDGIQTVIPYFYGGDAHVILIELWVEKPGHVADVTLRYKDMVELENATARASAHLGRIPREETPAELAVRRNVMGFRLAETLDRAAVHAAQGDAGAVRGQLEEARALAWGRDAALVDDFLSLVNLHGMSSREPALLSQALQLAGDRRVGLPRAAR